MRRSLEVSLQILIQAMVLTGCCSDSGSQTRRLRLKVAPSFSGPLALVVTNGVSGMDMRSACFECDVDERGIGSIPHEVLESWLEIEVVDALGHQADGRLMFTARYSRIDNSFLWVFVGSPDAERDWRERNSNPWVQRDWLVSRGIEMQPKEEGQPR